jgi:hypothetical protein
MGREFADRLLTQGRSDRTHGRTRFVVWMLAANTSLECAQLSSQVLNPLTSQRGGKKSCIALALAAVTRGACRQ